MTLDQHSPGEAVRIIAVDWDSLAEDEAKRLQALGLDAGAEISIAHRGIFFGHDPLAVRVGAMTIALRRSHARALTVEAL